MKFHNVGKAMVRIHELEDQLAMEHSDPIFNVKAANRRVDELEKLAAGRNRPAPEPRRADPPAPPAIQPPGRGTLLACFKVLCHAERVPESDAKLLSAVESAAAEHNIRLPWSSFAPSGLSGESRILASTMQSRIDSELAGYFKAIKPVAAPPMPSKTRKKMVTMVQSVFVEINEDHYPSDAQLFAALEKAAFYSHLRFKGMASEEALAVKYPYRKEPPNGIERTVRALKQQRLDDIEKL